MLPPFFLAPFDAAHPTQPAPRADFVAQWKGDEFVGCVCNGVLHFRNVEKNVPEWTFALSQPLAPELEAAPELWSLLWEEAMEREHIARMVCFRFRGAFDRDFPFYLGFDGRGWMRELWNRDDCAFDGGFSKTLARWGEEADLLESVQGIFLETVWNWLEELDVPGPFDEAPVEWLCGSLHELERLSRAIWALERGPKAEETAFVFQCETPFAGAMLWGAANVFSSRRDEVRPVYHPRFAPQKLSPRFFGLMDLALDFNTPSGCYWEYHDQGAGRAAYSPHGESFQIKIPIPSAHERAESLLLLRDWLRGKVPESEIEILLR